MRSKRPWTRAWRRADIEMGLIWAQIWSSYKTWRSQSQRAAHWERRAATQLLNESVQMQLQSQSNASKPASRTLLTNQIHQNSIHSRIWRSWKRKKHWKINQKTSWDKHLCSAIRILAPTCRAMTRLRTKVPTSTQSFKIDINSWIKNSEPITRTSWNCMNQSTRTVVHTE